MERDEIYTVLLFINIFWLDYKKLNKVHQRKSDVETKYFFMKFAKIFDYCSIEIKIRQSEF